jgi:hypothetical protein
MADPLGLISEINWATGQPHVGSAYSSQESYFLIRLQGPARCSGCGRQKLTTLVLGLAEIQLCDDCQPFKTTINLISDLMNLAN